MIWAVEEVAKTTRAVAKGSREIILMLMMYTLLGIGWFSVSGAEENRTEAVGGDRELVSVSFLYQAKDSKLAPPWASRSRWRALQSTIDE